MKIPNPLKLIAAIYRLCFALAMRHSLIVDNATADERARECHRRDGDCYDAVYGQCRVCTCFVGIKTLFATESCPRGYWGKRLLATVG
jgi:hypothetical protein